MRYRTAADLAVSLMGTLLTPLSAQIDPSEIGENSRTMSITKQYAERLDRHARNFQGRDRLTYLVESYPDHGFVIDRQEASEIFNRVFKPTPEMEAIEAALGDLARWPVDEEVEDAYEIHYLSSEPPPQLAAVPAAAVGGNP